MTRLILAALALGAVAARLGWNAGWTAGLIKGYRDAGRLIDRSEEPDEHEAGVPMTWEPVPAMPFFPLTGTQPVGPWVFTPSYVQPCWCGQADYHSHNLNANSSPN